MEIFHECHEFFCWCIFLYYLATARPANFGLRLRQRCIKGCCYIQDRALCVNSSRLPAVNYYHKALYLGCCNNPRFTSARDHSNSPDVIHCNLFAFRCILKLSVAFIKVLEPFYHLYTNMKRYVIWCNLYNLKNVKNTHGGVLPLVKLKAEAGNFTKSNTPPWVFFKLCKWYQIVQRITYLFCTLFVLQYLSRLA